MALRPRDAGSLAKGSAQAREHRRDRARAARLEDRRRKELDKQAVVQERYRHELHIQRYRGLAAQRTMKVEKRIQLATIILRASLANDVVPLDFEKLKPNITPTPLDLGADASPEPAPQWKDFAPPLHSAALHLVYRRHRHHEALTEAAFAFEQAVSHHHDREQARQQRVEAARQQHEADRSDAERRALADCQRVDHFRRQVWERNRHAASRYFEMVLERCPKDPSGFPRDFRVGYAPESSTVTVEWVLPHTTIIPPEKEYRFDESEDQIVVHKWRSSTEIRQIYHDIAAQIALRTLNAIFGSDPDDLVESVVVNGVVKDVGEITGRASRPCLLTLCATRGQFKRIKLQNVTNSVEFVRKHFGAKLSRRPDDFEEVPALRPFTVADTALVEVTDATDNAPATGCTTRPAPSGSPATSDTDAAGAAGTDDRRPNLLTFNASELRRFLDLLLDRMGLDPERFSPCDEGGLECVATDPTPALGGTVLVQAKLNTKPVPVSQVRALHHAANRATACRAILVTTGGFHPSSLSFARGKALELYDGQGLLAL